MLWTIALILIVARAVGLVTSHLLSRASNRALLRHAAATTAEMASRHDGYILYILDRHPCGAAPCPASAMTGGHGPAPGCKAHVHRGWLAGSVALYGLLGLASCSNTGAAALDFQVRGATVVLNSTAPFTRRPDFPARVESTIDEALRYWGGAWVVLDGMTITFDGDRNVRCDGMMAAIGCYDGSIHVSTRDVATVFNCVEETVLVHEIGHAVVGDPDHTDPRWMDFGAVQRRLDGRPGYDEQGSTSCSLHVSVWRHPPQHDGREALQAKRRPEPVARKGSP